jgi:glycosyltransferase involved in cell wall biosynthesis
MNNLDSKLLVSVVIPAFNRARTIEAAVKSVQAQTYANWEVIVSDDGSTDNTKEVVGRMIASDGRIRFIGYEKNRGAQAARNAGIKAAKGEWIAFLDSDDEWLPESLQLRLTVASHDHVSVVHSGAYIVHTGKPREIYPIPQWSGQIYKKVLTGEGPIFPTLLVKREALERIGYLDEKIVSYQEWDTAIRLSKEFLVGFEPKPTFVYDYRSTDAISRDNVRAGRGYEQIVRKHMWAIIAQLGPEALWQHLDVAAQWYKKGNATLPYWRCRSIAVVGKCCNPKRWIRKVFK